MAAADAMLKHEDVPLDVRNAATSTGVRASHIARSLSAPSLPPHTRQRAKDELAKLIKEARELWEIV